MIIHAFDMFGQSGVARGRYMNTTAVKSRISYIDGDKGILRYRGYPIEVLAERSSFLEVVPLACCFPCTRKCPVKSAKD